MITTIDTVIRVTPPRAAAAPMIAYVPGVTQGMSGSQFANAKKVGWFCTQISMTIPTARPKRAPTAMEGRMIPAGICRPNVIEARKNPRMAANRSRKMVPAVAAPVLQSPN